MRLYREARCRRSVNLLSTRRAPIAVDRRRLHGDLPCDSATAHQGKVAQFLRDRGNLLHEQGQGWLKKALGKLKATDEGCDLLGMTAFQLEIGVGVQVESM